jgi:NAD(P)-dependent dehydrogenase (short-subunit alcohol dehydrogenase family)
MMSSVGGRFGYPDRSPYATTKRGLIGFMETWQRTRRRRHPGERHRAGRGRGRAARLSTVAARPTGGGAARPAFVVRSARFVAPLAGPMANGPGDA